MVSKRPDDLWEEYPFASHWMEQPGGRQHFLDEGEGRPVVMVHGNPTWSYYFRHLVKALSPERRCIVPDHLGCGLSEKPSDFGYRLADHIGNLERLLEHLGVDRFDLVVHDWGGPIGLGAGLRRPERLNRVVVLNTAAFASKRIPARIAFCRIPLFGEWVVRGLNGFAWPAARMATARGLSKAVRGHYLFPYGSWKDRRAIARFVQDIPLEPDHPSYPELERIEAGLEGLREKPVRIFWGGRDFCFNWFFFEEWKRRLPEAEATLYAEAGHYVLEDAHPEVTESIRDFLCGD